MQKLREMIQFDLFFIFFKCETKKQRFTNKFDDVSQGGMFFFFWILQVVRPVVEYVDKEGSCVGAMDP